MLHNLPAGNWSAGERGIACHPDRRVEFADGVTRAIDYARALGCPQVNCLAGIVPGDVTQAAAHATFVSNVRLAAARLDEAGIQLLIEPINTRDIPGFFLTHTRQALAIIDAVGSTMSPCSTTSTTCRSWKAIWRRRSNGTCRASGTCRSPIHRRATSRAPAKSTTDFLLNWIDRLGYDGWIGLEYKPAGRTEDGLRWIEGGGWKR